MTHNELAASLRRGDLNAARSQCETSLDGNPENAEALHDLGAILCCEGDLAGAIAHLSQALRLEPDRPSWLQDLGIAYAAAGRWQEAASTLTQACALAPLPAASHDLLADIHTQLQEYDKALPHTEEVARLRPVSATALGRLALGYWRVGDLPESLAVFRQALSLEPTTATLRSTFLFVLLHDPAASPHAVFEEHRSWSQGHPRQRPSQRAGGNSQNAGRKLRIGYLSAEFFLSASYFFLAPILRNHDRSALDVYLYHTRPRRDRHTYHFEEAASCWREVRGLSDEQIADQIRADQIDILVDLTGHLENCRLGVFRLRPAPVQAAFPNYPATTGLMEIDYLFTDAWTDPPGMTEALYTEELYRLSSGHLCYAPPEDTPPVSELPAVAAGYVTFGLFQRPAKIHDRMWDAVAQVLARVPGSRLLVHHGARDLDEPDGPARARVIEALRIRGIPADRLRFRGAVPLRDHFALLAQADIALDAFPYNGQTTTCECLWMGVPVATLAGDTHVSRVGYGLLMRAGLSEWIAHSWWQYVDIAVQSAGDLEGLARLRTRMRHQIASSSLMDGRRIASEMEEAYRCMWRRFSPRIHRTF